MVSNADVPLRSSDKFPQPGTAPNKASFTAQAQATSRAGSNERCQCAVKGSSCLHKATVRLSQNLEGVKIDASIPKLYKLISGNFTNLVHSLTVHVDILCSPDPKSVPP